MTRRSRSWLLPLVALLLIDGVGLLLLREASPLAQGSYAAEQSFSPYPPAGAGVIALLVMANMGLGYSILQAWSPPGRRGGLLYGLLFALLTLSTTEGILDWYVRTNAGAFRPHPVRLWTLAPGLRDHWHVVESLTTNSLGLRSPEIPVEKPPGEFRVLLLGDSAMYGHGVEESATFARRLEGLLRRRDPSRPVAVINAAVPGYTTYQGKWMLREVGLALSPDVIVVGFNNDGTLDWIADKDRMPGGRRAARVRRVLYRFQTYHALRSLLPAGRPAGGRLVPRVDNPDIEQNLGEIGVMAEQAGARLAFLYMPYAPGSSQPYYGPLLEKVARRKGAVVVDVNGAWRRRPSAGWFLPGDPVHPNETGHGQLAIDLLEGLERQGLLPPRAQGR